MINRLMGEGKKGGDIKLFVVDEDNRRVQEICNIFQNHPRIKVVYIASSMEEIESWVNKAIPDAALVSAMCDFCFRAVDTIVKRRPETRVFIFSDEVDIPFSLEAKKHNVEDVVSYPIDRFEIGVQIEQSVDNFRDWYRDKYQKAAFKKSRIEERAGRSDVKFVKDMAVMVVSPKGGVGKTTISVNLACAVAALGRTSVETALVDFNKFGTTLVQLGFLRKDLEEMDETRSILSFNYIDEDSVKFEGLTDYMLRHEKSGLWVVPPVSNLESFSKIDGLLLEKIIKILRSYFRFIVMDVPLLTESDVFISCIKYVDMVICVVDQDYQAVNSLVHLERELSDVGGTSKCVRVVNKYRDDAGIEIDELNEISTYPLLGVIRFDDKVRKAINRGRPLVLSDSDSPFSRDIITVANKIYPVFNLYQDKGDGLLGSLTKILSRKSK